MPTSIDSLGTHAPPSRNRRDLLVHLLCLMILTLVAGAMLHQVGVGRLVCPASPEASGDAELDELLFAIDRADVPAVRRVLRRGRADVNGADVAGGTPLHYAVRARGASASVLMDLLIEAGADVTAHDRARTPLLLSAVPLRRPELAARLLRAGADPNGSTINGWTALHFAAMCDDPETVAVLLAAGADPHVKDDRGRTPLDEALASGSRATAALLRAAHCSASSLR